MSNRFYKTNKKYLRLSKNKYLQILHTTTYYLYESNTCMKIRSKRNVIP